MRITADTNVLVRILVADDEAQARAAAAALEQASLIAVAMPTWCELAWVLRSVYRLDAADIAHGIRTLLNLAKLTTSRAAVEQGLALLAAGGDFADGAIAAEGALAGGDVFVSFDAKATHLLQQQGHKTQRLTA